MTKKGEATMLKRSQAKRLRFFVAITAGITLSFLSSGQVNDRSTLRGGKSGALQTAKMDPATGPAIDFPLGTATPSEVCGECHGAVYFEAAFGLGADLKWKPITALAGDSLLSLPPQSPDTGTAHYLAGVDPWPIRARQIENGGASCNTCHYPQPFELPDINTPIITEPPHRPPDLEST